MKYRIFAQYENGFQTIGYSSSYAAACRRADAFMASLDPNTDDCPEMVIEVTHGAR
jgi:hypothetical protein